MNIDLIKNQFCDYSKHIKGYSPQTIRRYRHSIEFFCKQQRISNIDEITSTHLQLFFIDGRSQRGWKTNSYLSYHKSLAVFLRWCKQNGYIVSDPIEHIEVPKRERKIPPKLTRQDALLLLEIVYNYPHVNPFLRIRNHAIFATFIFAGLRKQELLHLKYMEVDIVNGTIFVQQGKGGKDRIIPIPGTLSNILHRYTIERNKRKVGCPYFFISSVNDGKLNDTAIKRLIDRFRRISNIPFTAHKLRHTFATLMLEGGCDIYSLSKMMGHNDITTTTIYLAASVEHLRAQIHKHPLNDIS